MFTGCPMCSTLLQVSEEQLAAKRGMVRCGHCNEVFDASDHCHEDMQDALARPHRPLTGPPELTPQAPDTIDLDAQLTDEKPDDHAPAGEQEATSEHDSTASPDEPIPWERPAPNESTLSTTRGVFWGMALLGVLCVQVWHFEHDRLLSEPQWRAYFERAAQALSIDIPLFEDRSQLSIVDRALRPHPDRPDALRFHLTLHNVAPFRQSYPVVRLSLNDDQQRVLAQADIPPRDYLQTASINEGIAAQSSVELVIDVLTPDGSVDGFTFDLL